MATVGRIVSHVIDKNDKNQEYFMKLFYLETMFEIEHVSAQPDHFNGVFSSPSQVIEYSKYLLLFTSHNHIIWLIEFI